MKKNIFIIILSVIVLGLGGYLYYDKVIDKGVNEEVKEEVSKEENKEFDLAEAKKIIDRYSVDNFFMIKILNDKMTEDDKIILTIFNSETSNVNYSCGDAFSGKTEELERCSDPINIAYDYEKLNKLYKELFGNKQDLPKKMVSSGVSSYSYSEKYNSYMYLSSAGGYGPIFTYYDVTGGIEKDGILEINVNYMTGELGEDDKRIYVENTNINVPIIDDTNVTNEEIKNLYNKALSENEIPKYKFTFKKSDTGYYLDSIIKVIY